MAIFSEGVYMTPSENKTANIKHGQVNYKLIYQSLEA